MALSLLRALAGAFTLGPASNSGVLCVDMEELRE